MTLGSSTWEDPHGECVCVCVHEQSVNLHSHKIFHSLSQEEGVGFLFMSSQLQFKSVFPGEENSSEIKGEITDYTVIVQLRECTELHSFNCSICPIFTLHTFSFSTINYSKDLPLAQGIKFEWSVNSYCLLEFNITCHRHLGKSNCNCI